MPRLVGLLLGLQLVVASPVWMPQFLSGGSGRNIRHLPCVSRRTGEHGTCMFAFSCAKANGTHLGTCIDRFYFGSCCHIPGGDNNTLANSIIPSNAATIVEVPDKPTRRPTTPPRPVTDASTEPSYQLSTFQSVQDNNAPGVTAVKVTDAPPRLDSPPPSGVATSKPRPGESATNRPRPVVTNRPPLQDATTAESTTTTTTESLTVVSLITKPTSKPVKPAKPVKPTARPVKTTARPATTTAPPKTTAKPAKPVKPATTPSTTAKPVKLATTTPTTTTAKPVKTTSNPVKATTAKPVKTTAKPVKTTAKPVKVTQKPAKKPATSSTTAAPPVVKPRPTKPPRPSSKPVTTTSTETPAGLVTWMPDPVTEGSQQKVTTQKVTVQTTASTGSSESWELLPALAPGADSGSFESSTSKPATTTSPSTTPSTTSTESSSSTSVEEEEEEEEEGGEEEEEEETATPVLIDQATTVSHDVELPVTTTPASTPGVPDGLNMSDFRAVCGRRLFPEARVVGGEKSTFGKWPWQISLRQWRTSTYLHKCGAALLNENWAITAAHCVENVPPSDLLLRLGEHDLSTEDEPHGFQERRVQIVAAHPQFDPRTFEYDLALLRFYEPAKFQPNVLPVCVPQDDTNFVGATAHVTGWGRLYEDGPLPSVLQEVRVPVINNTLCETMYRSAGYIEHIPEIFICAGWKKGGFDSCEGDSGGPMVIQRPDRRWLLAGVISWGIGCAEPNQPGVYTRISEFRDWINQILQF